MNRFEWDALRVSDPVEVHDPAFPVLPSRPGTVVRVTVRVHRPNEVAIRFDGPDSRVVVPLATTVHRHDPAEGACWRCEELERRSG